MTMLGFAGASIHCAELSARLPHAVRLPHNPRAGEARAHAPHVCGIHRGAHSHPRRALPYHRHSRKVSHIDRQKDSHTHTHTHTRTAPHPQHNNKPSFGSFFLITLRVTCCRELVRSHVWGIVTMLHFVLMMYVHARQQEWTHRLDFLWKSQVPKSSAFVCLHRVSHFLLQSRSF